jgi:hypothetical protein
MWCSHCQQDVPAVPRDGAPGLQCVRCKQLATQQPPPVDEQPVPPGVEPIATVAQESPLATQLLPPLPQEDWELEAELRYVQRLAQTWKEPLAAEPAEFPLPTTAVPEQPARETVSDATPRETKSRFAGLAWGVLSLGVMAFVCGGVLLGWSAITGRNELWSLGLPLTLFGQAGLILGLVLQLESLWQTNRATSQTLTQLDGELHELRHSTTLLTQSRSTPAQSFYLHLAEGASPHLLLADLKGQLDLLSEQLSKRR